MSFERELAPSLGFRVMYINRIVDGSLETINAKRPYEAYNIPITRRDPGPDGVLNNSDDGGSITLYDYAASYTGANFVSNKRVNAINTDRFDTVEFTVTRRATDRWSGQISYFAVKNRRWLNGVYQSPNDEFFPVDETWGWAGNISGTYRLPYNISVSGFLQSQAGIKGQRTNIFRTADPDGGKPITQNGNTTIRLEPYGSQQSVCLQYPQPPGEQRFPVEPGTEDQPRFRYLQPVEFRDTDERRLRVGADVRLRAGRHAAAHHAHRRAVHVLDGEASMKPVKLGERPSPRSSRSAAVAIGSSATSTSTTVSPTVRVRRQSLNCDMSQYKAASGSDCGHRAGRSRRDVERIELDRNCGRATAIDNGQPVVRELAVRKSGGQWAPLGQNLHARVLREERHTAHDDAAGRSRCAICGVDITAEVIEKNRWYAFWDAPFVVPGVPEPNPARGRGEGRGAWSRDNRTGVAGRAGGAAGAMCLRDPKDACMDCRGRPTKSRRPIATFKATGCSVKTDGARVEVNFPGLSMGIFAGSLQFTSYRGSNLLRMEAIAKTDQHVGGLQVRRRSAGLLDVAHASGVVARSRRRSADSTSSAASRTTRVSR